DVVAPRDAASPPQSRAEQARNLLVSGEALQRELRVHELSVDRDLERTALRLDELDLGIGERALDLGGQTDRLRQVVSLNAVLDRDLHGSAHILSTRSRGRNRPRLATPEGVQEVSTLARVRAR